MEITLRQYNSPQKLNLGVRQQLATLATPTIRSIKCKQSPVYGVLWPLLPHPSTDRNETRTWSSLSPLQLSHKIWYNPFTIFLVIVVTDIQTDTHTQTNAGKTYSSLSRGEQGFLRSKMLLCVTEYQTNTGCQTDTKLIIIWKQWLDRQWQLIVYHGLLLKLCTDR